ncbi:MAG: PQQ-dependent sugar dehydrogenase [Bdellovibrionota bacterium]
MRFLVIIASLSLVQCSWMGNVTSVDKKPSRGLASSNSILDKSGYLYDPKDTSCDGFPRLQVETMPGTCLGLVLPRDRAVDPDAKKSFIMPRTLAQIPGTKDFLVVDMGGWKDNNGSLYLLQRGTNGQYGLKLLKTGLNKPHGLVINPDGFVYLGETQRISRFHFNAGKMDEWQLVIGHLPRPKGDMHPLTQFTFDPNSNDLFLNTGAPTDHCYVKDNGSYANCPEDTELGMGAIYRIPGFKLKDIPPSGILVMELTAAGLRNSMAMAVHSSGTLLQGENGRDFPELEEPYEEINVIDPKGPGFHYGWPYCFDFHGVSPEWKFPENARDPLRKQFTKPVDCALKVPTEMGEYHPPYALMPPHAAPLHAAYYQGDMFEKQLGGKLLISWHGYQPTGHRLVAYSVDEKGRPLTTPLAAGLNYAFDTKGGCPTARPFAPNGGADRLAPYVEVISRWDEQKGIRPKGSPVGFTVASDGSIWIAEDKENRTIVRLAHSDDPQQVADCDPANSNAIDPRIELLAWRSYLSGNAEAASGYENLRNKLTLKYCTGCHGNFQEKDIASDRFSNLDFFVKNEWFKPGKASASKIYSAISQKGELEFPPMPPSGQPQFLGTPEGDEILKLTADWINALPTNIGNSIKRIKLISMRRVRSSPSAKGKVCGQFDAGGITYLDSDEKTEIVAEGFRWARTYVLPGDSRLFKQACPYPVDGVFYTALRKE